MIQCKHMFAKEEKRAAAEMTGARKAILDAAAEKFRPVLMSSAASLFGMLPMAFGSGLGSELRAAIGLGSVGGILLSALVSLYLIPALTSLARR